MKEFTLRCPIWWLIALLSGSASKRKQKVCACSSKPNCKLDHSSPSYLAISQAKCSFHTIHYGVMQPVQQHLTVVSGFSVCWPKGRLGPNCLHSGIAMLDWALLSNRILQGLSSFDIMWGSCWWLSQSLPLQKGLWKLLQAARHCSLPSQGEEVRIVTP